MSIRLTPLDNHLIIGFSFCEAVTDVVSRSAFIRAFLEHTALLAESRPSPPKSILLRCLESPNNASKGLQGPSPRDFMALLPAPSSPAGPTAGHDLQAKDSSTGTNLNRTLVPLLTFPRHRACLG